MTDDLIVRARQSCCRLCLAPDSECVPILTSLAADKEPLSTKIHACVNIKVNQTDRLSSRVCHSCISFLNSWQSFKNRCLAAQMKQMNWLEMAKNSMRRQIGQMQQHQNASSMSRRNNKFSPNKNSQQRPMPCPFIVKEEPIDEEADAQEAAMKGFDPMQYLDENEIRKREESEEDSLLRPSRIRNEEPQILTSLGLTHINSVNPYSIMNNSFDGNKLEDEDYSTPNLGVNSSTCRVCNVILSSGPNARRHERNVHGKVLNELNLKTEMPEMYAKPSPTHRLSLLKPIMPHLKPAPPVTPEMMGIYDYDQPEKYRHLLTDSKLAFIRRHEEFLTQYQDMTCICCPKTFPTYKIFMAHMRKKYQNLSRNLCFKCIKQFQSKATFVSHLKKKNCINLYKLYKADETIPKSGPMGSSPEKMGTKELLTNKVYECKLCTKTFRLKMEFRTHVYDDHAEILRRDVAPGLCGFCDMEIEDPAIRRRHYNNMECIVMLHCGTCEAKFENHQKFIEHVYQVHLPIPVNNNEDVLDSTDSSMKLNSSNSDNIFPNAFNSRLPHSCIICGQRYNNYYNVLRHMEGKHPDQVPKRYICEICNEGFPRQGPLREHMHEVHGTTLPRTRRESMSCRMCSDVFDSREKWIKHQTEMHSRYTCCVCNYQNKSLEEFTNHIETHAQLASKNSASASVTIMSVTTNGGVNDDEEEQDEQEEMEQEQTEEEQTKEEEPAEEEEIATPPPKRMKMDGNTKECPICHSSFNGNLGLSNHMRSHFSHEKSKSTSRIVTIKKKHAYLNSVSRKSENSTEIRRIRCRICHKRFTSKKTYRKHMLVDHQVRNVNFIKCGICKAEFTHDKGLKVHLYKLHGIVMSSETVDIHFECEICFAMFKKELELTIHKSLEHSGQNNEQEEKPEKSEKQVQQQQISNSSTQQRNTPSLWYQCRYCPSYFDTNKKLAIHVNSHNEFNPTDFSCKDCGNVYNGRKSLWVHRYKKHPLIADPAACKICQKTFFDKNMLLNHLKNHSDPSAKIYINELKAKMGDSGNNETVNTTTNVEDDEFEEDEDEDVILMGKVHCSVCNEEFTDQDLFDKHMETHQVDLYSDNPLAAMFDTGPEDPNQQFQLSDNGAYTCDICPKTFAVVQSLKIHRNWHFRTDSKQISIEPNWARASASKKNSNHVCEFCDSSFASSSNLRRHIAEIHNRESIDNPDPSKVFVDKYLECTKCALKFETKSEWVNHKITHAKDSASSAFEWVCEICGKIVSRKERLLQHMNSHLKIKKEKDDGTGSIVSEDQSNSQDSAMSSNAGRISAMEKLTTGDDDEEDEDEEDDENEEPVTYHQENIQEAEEIIDDTHENGDDDDDEDDEHYGEPDDDDDDDEHATIIRYDGDDDEDESSQHYQEIDPNQDDEDEEEEEDQDNSGSYSCDLCQVYFETSKQLRRHVTSHFLNGPGSVTLTEIPKEKNFPAKVQLGEDVTTITPV